MGNLLESSSVSEIKNNVSKIGKHLVEVLESKEIAMGTLGLRLAKPKGFEYKAGQFIMVRMPCLLDKGLKESTRAMSLASAPFENDLLVSMRISDSEFKKEACKLKAGDKLEIEGPFGRLTMEDQTAPTVFIGGGIGITPFRSLVLDQEKKGWPIEISLFYSGRTLETSPFLEEFQKIKSDKFKFVFVVSRPQELDKQWNGDTGRINAQMLKKYLDDPTKYFYYVVGLPEMVIDVRKNLELLGIPKEKIKFEHFSGYHILNGN